MGSTERIRFILVKRGNMNESELARRLGISRQRLDHRMKRDDFKESELEEIAKALNCTYKTTFTLNDTGETF